MVLDGEERLDEKGGERKKKGEEARINDNTI